MPEGRPDGSSAKERLDVATTSISDGTAVDWVELEDAVEGTEERRVVEALRELARVAEAHRGAADDLASVGTLGRETLPLEGGEAELPAEVPHFWGHLEILAKVGEGGFGEVFRVRDTKLERVAALKLIHSGKGHPAGRAAAVLREGRLLARVNHPNVATIFGADQRDGRVGFWMELVEGETLSELVARQGPLDAREVAAIGVDLCRALAAVHAQGVVHRDVKAQNVMREAGGRILLVDFGIGLDLQGEGPEDRSLSGTPLYLAPECFAGEPATFRSDLYSLGVLLFYLATGEFPVEGRSMAELRKAHQEGARRSLRDLRPDLPKRFVRVVETALAWDPGARFGSAGQMEGALAGCMASHVSEAALRWGVIAAVLILVVVGWSVGHQLGPSPAEAPLADAAIFYQKQDSAAAVSAVNRAIELDPGYVPAYKTLAQYQAARGRLSDAFGASERAYGLRGKLEPNARAEVAGTYLMYGLRYSEALGAFLTVPEQERSSTVERQIAHMHAKLGDYRDAQEALDRALLIDPDDPISWGMKVILLTEENRPTDAAALAEKARIHVPNSPYLYWGEGLMLLGQGDSRAAEDAFLAMLDEGSALTSWARGLAAQARILRGDLEGAIRILEEGLVADHRHGFEQGVAAKSVALARLHNLLGQTEEARLRLVFADELADQPPSIRHLRNAALLRLSWGDEEECLKILGRIKSIQLAYPSPIGEAIDLQVTGELDKRRGNLKGVRTSLEKAWAKSGEPSMAWSLATFYQEQGEWERAKRYWDLLIEEKKGEILRNEFAGMWVLAHLERARCQRALGDEEGAAASLEGAGDLWRKLREE